MTSPFIRKRPRRYCRGQYKGEGPRLRAQSHADELRFNCRRLRFGQFPAQFGFQYLAVIVLRQGLDKAVLARPLEAGDVVEAQLVERGFRHLSFRLRDNKRDDLLAQSGCGRPTTEASTTSGWRSNTSSISRG